MPIKYILTAEIEDASKTEDVKPKYKKPKKPKKKE